MGPGYGDEMWSHEKEQDLMSSLMDPRGLARGKGSSFVKNKVVGNGGRSPVFLNPELQKHLYYLASFVLSCSLARKVQVARTLSANDGPN